jgi:hypothetical protein
MTEGHRRVVTSLFGSQQSNTGQPSLTPGFDPSSVRIAAGATGPRNAGEIRPGDVLTYSVNGQQQSVTLTQAQAADIMQRTNIVNNALNGTHWRSNGYSDQPQIVGSNGQVVPWQSGQGNGVWQYATVPGTNRLGIVPAAGVTPAQAVDDLLAHQGSYRFDCGGGARALNMISELQTLRQMHGTEQGNAIFNQRYANVQTQGGGSAPGCLLYVLTDSSDRVYTPGANGQPGSYSYSNDGGAWCASPQGTNPMQGAPTIAGNRDWFRYGTPDAVQGAGWNAVFLGFDTQGRPQYWTFEGTPNRAPTSPGSPASGLFVGTPPGMSHVFTSVTDTYQLVQGWGNRPATAN